MYFLPFRFIKVFSSTWYTICTQQIIVKLNCIIYSLSQFHLLKQKNFHILAVTLIIEIPAGPSSKSGEHDRIKLQADITQNECQKRLSILIWWHQSWFMNYMKNWPPYFSVTPFLDKTWDPLVFDYPPIAALGSKWLLIVPKVWIHLQRTEIS